MGIRFHCEHCTKRVHVKEHLAGRKAKCPHCEQRIVIPAESTVTSKKDAAKKDAAVPVIKPESARKHSEAGNKNKRAVPEVKKAKDGVAAQPAARTVSGNGAELAVGKESQTQKAVHTATADATSEASASTTKPESTDASPAQRDVPADSSETFVDVPANVKPRQSTDSDPAESEVATTPDRQQAEPASDSSPDIFSEAPDALWYVAPPTGGKYGPADAKMLQTWIEEGRVSADSLVWREGWQKWQPASVVMSKTQNQSATQSEVPVAAAKSSAESTASIAEADGSPAQADPVNRPQAGLHAAPSSLRYQQKRRRSKSLGVALILGLALLSIALVVGLVIAVMNT